MTAAKKFRPGQLVTVATATGTRPAVIVTGKISRAGYVKVQLQYRDDPIPTHGIGCRTCFGAPRPFHISDVKARR